MKRILLLVLGLVILPAAWAEKKAPAPEKNVVASKPIPYSPPKHERRMHVDSHGQIYVPKEMPLYIYVSTHPDGSNAQPLDNKGTYEEKLKNKGKATPSPLVLHEGEGRHTLIHPEDEFWTHKKKIKLSDQAIHYIHVDETAPGTWVVPGASPSVKRKGRQIFGKPVQLQLKGQDKSDSRSGLAGIWVDQGQGMMAYGGPLGYEREGDYEISYYGVDNVGNIEATSRYRFALDLTPPGTQHQFSGPKVGDLVSPESSLTLTAQDASAGVENLYFRLEGPTQLKGRYLGPFAMKQLDEGAYRLTYWALDQVGNKSFETTVEFVLDSSPPKVQLLPQGPSYRSKNKLFVDASTKLALEAVDAKGGPVKLRWTLGATFADYQSPLALPEGKSFPLRFFALDQVGNSSVIEQVQVLRDLQAPDSSYLLFGPIHHHGGRSFVSTRTKIRFQAEDADSGVAEVKYRVNQGAWTAFQQNFSIEEEGEQLIEFASQDRVGNQEPTKKLRLVIDNTPPEISTQFGSQPIGEEAGKKVYAKNSILFIVSVDQASGLSQLQYQLGDNKPSIFGEPLRFPNAGSYRIAIAAEDKVGNREFSNLEFIIR